MEKTQLMRSVKKCLAYIMCLAVMLSVAITPMAATPVGDLNGDDLVSAPDLSALTTVLFAGIEDVAYDINGDGKINILDLIRLKKNIALAAISVSAPVDAVDGKVSEGVTISGNGISAYVPAGVLLEDGVDTLTLTVTPLTTSSGDIDTADSETITPYDVHISGISKSNTIPIIIDLGAVMPKFLNIGNYRLYHVEDGVSNLMTLVASRDELDAHNEFAYIPATGELSVAMATFSEVAVVSAAATWEGEFDYSWYTKDPNALEFTIANGDQLAALGAIVGGMDGQAQNSFAGKTVNLIADINLGDKESENDESKIFYPIGYYNSEGTYERTNTAITSGLRNFEGTFDGNGHTISNFYHNTWEMKGDHDWYSPEEQYYRDGMGLFGRVYGGTVKNLTVDNFSSDGEIATTGVIAAYADFGATFENIAITNCNPRVYNIGNGGIVGCVGWYTTGTTDKKVTFTNITVDNSNKISALWGSWDVACGGIVGQYYPTSGQSSANYPVNAGVDFVNCHVAAQIDVYNDVCANYQYYAYRYAGMMIGSIRENETINGHVYPKMDDITANNCTVHYDTWNDYFYCELVANSLASYTHDHQFSRLDMVDSVDVENKTITIDGKTTEIPTSGRYNYVVVKGDFATENATCYHFVDGAVWNHEDAGTETVNGVEVLKENNQHIYLPFAQLFTGYGWGVTSKGIDDYTGIEVKHVDQKDSVEKFKARSYVEQLNINNLVPVAVGSLFEAIDGKSINGSGVVVTIDKVNEDDNVSGVYKADPDNWQGGTIEFSGTGLVDITIQDYDYCTPTTITLNVKDSNPSLINGDFEFETNGQKDVVPGFVFDKYELTSGYAEVIPDEVPATADANYDGKLREGKVIHMNTGAPYANLANDPVGEYQRFRLYQPVTVTPYTNYTWTFYIKTGEGMNHFIGVVAGDTVSEEGNTTIPINDSFVYDEQDDKGQSIFRSDGSRAKTINNSTNKIGLAVPYNVEKKEGEVKEKGGVICSADDQYTPDPNWIYFGTNQRKWNKVEITFNSGANTAVCLTYVARHRGRDVYFDDWKLDKGINVTENVENGDFETATTNDKEIGTIIPGFVFNRSIYNSGAAEIVNDTNRNSNVLKLTTGPDGSAPNTGYQTFRLYQPVKVNKNTNYKWTFWVNPALLSNHLIGVVQGAFVYENGNNTLEITARQIAGENILNAYINDSTGGAVSKAGSTEADSNWIYFMNENNGGWRQIEVTFNSGNNDIISLAYVARHTGREIYFDDWTLTEVNPAE